LKQSEYNLLRTRRNSENPFEKANTLDIYTNPLAVTLKKEYHSIISQYLKEQNFDYDVVADLGCGLPYATLPFAQEDNKTLCCIDGYKETHKRYYFSKQELDNFFAVQSGDVTFYDLDSEFDMPKVDVWISIMAVGELIDPRYHYNFIKDFSKENTKIIFVVFEDNWYDSIKIKNIIADKNTKMDFKLSSNVGEDLVLAEVEFTCNRLSV